MHHYFYLSSASHEMTLDELEEILAVSRRNNSELGVTGMLLYCDGTIIQYLEGPEEMVNLLRDRIRLDPRHKGLIKLSEGPVDGRLFGDWAWVLRAPTMDQEALI